MQHCRSLAGQKGIFFKLEYCRVRIIVLGYFILNIYREQLRWIYLFIDRTKMTYNLEQKPKKNRSTKKKKPFRSKFFFRFHLFLWQIRIFASSELTVTQSLRCKHRDVMFFAAFFIFTVRESFRESLPNVLNYR